MAQSHDKTFVSYNQLHRLIRRTFEKNELVQRFSPTLIVAISAGGFLPARILRHLIKSKTGQKSLSIQTIGLSLYENDDRQISKTQWISSDYRRDPLPICFSGENILIVDEVDETRTTLSYAVRELKNDIERQRISFEHDQKTWIEPKIGIFVVHNKNVPKQAELPDEIMKNFYFVGENVGSQWIVYPWDALDIDEHTRLAENSP